MSKVTVTFENTIKEEISNILETGVDALILGNLYLAELINQRFKDINTICSINLKTDSVYKLKSYLIDFGFNFFSDLE